MSEEDQKMETNEGEDAGDSSDSDLEEQSYLKRVEELENEISSNKYLYDAHVELVELYRKLGDLNSMRAAFHRFHEYFPLTPKLWLDWIKDEIKLANTPTEQKEVIKLFDQAVEDYLSIDIWVEYAQYSIGVNDLQTTRLILERGLTAAGLHCTEGSLLWDTLRELENAHISLYTEGSEDWKAQVHKLSDVFKRQLSVPLIDMENTYNEWQEWFKGLPEGTVDSQPIEWGYKKAVNLLEKYKPFEEKLLMTQENEESYQVYKEYIKIVKDPSTVMCIYERAALPLCLFPNLWLDYCLYALKLGDTALKVSSRALRNCPWSEELWIIRLRILEKQKKEENEILDCFEKALSNIRSAGIELWLSYIEYIHRNSPSVEKVDKLFDQAIYQLGTQGDQSFKLHRLHARIFAHRGDIEAARKLWNSILSKPQNKGTANLWLEYINLERQYGDITHLRTLFQRACSACTDWPEYISEEWLMHERQFGTLEDVLKCMGKCKDLAKIKPQYQITHVQAEPTRYEKEIPKKGNKRRHDLDHEAAVEMKKVRSDSEMKLLKPQFKPKPLPVEKDPKKGVFISNLHPGVDENRLKEMFHNAVNIEIVHDRKGKSRCYGYVQFSMEEETMTALARDREPLNGRPVFISEIKSEKAEKKPVFKYAAAEEKNKLFVRGLPIKKTHEEIEDIFKQYGAKDVRLVYHKSGQPKGLAYVEFISEEDAQNALKKTDQMKIDDHTITVAISAPPPKKGHPDINKEEEPIRHARSRLQMPLIPRSLQVKHGEKNENKEAKETNGSKKEVPKTNADFRNMLLKK